MPFNKRVGKGGSKDAANGTTEAREERHHHFDAVEDVSTEEDHDRHRRTYRLFDTSVEVRTDQGDRIWEVALETALVERMGCNNTGYIAQTCPADDYNRFVLSARGENFFGCSTDITELPYFDVYLDRARRLYAAHLANARFGMPLSVFRRGYEHRMRDMPAERTELEVTLEERMAVIVKETKETWAEDCAKYRERYGDVYAEVFGPDAPPPAPHGR